MREEHNNHFLYLDGMRGLAAILVGILHLMGDKGFHLQHAALAVDFFFCLSGFVIAYSYSGRIDRSISKKQFMLARVIRLYPLLLLGIVEGSIVLTLGALRSGPNALKIAGVTSILSLAFIPAGLLFARSAFPPDAPMWSLFWEFLAYLSYGLVTIKSERRVVYGVLGFLVLLIITVAFYRNLLFLGYYTPNMFWGGIARIGFPFSAGVLIHRLGLYRNRSAGWSWLALVGLLAMLVFPMGGWQIDLVGVMGVFPMLVIAGTAQAGKRVAPFLRLLGEVSYPFYVMHDPILRVLRTFPAVGRFRMSNPIVATVVILVPILLVALAVSRLYDVPVRRWLTRVTGGRTVSAATSMPLVSESRS